MGRGVEAAASMAEIRSTIRAYALDDPDPVSVFERVDRFFEVLGSEQLVTVLYFLIDPSSHDVQIINAGHLPPLLVTREAPTIIETAEGTPFGVRAIPREAVTISLPAEAALVALTDGLVERRGEDIDEGIARVVEAARGAVSWNAHKLLTHVVTMAAAERTHDDDVTVLVLRRH
jgi:serine phosphatase RsbU (regulator of sigma subunit)